jgi:transglutaminase-like putative cysteine protease
MNLIVTHTSRYSYSKPVWLQPQIIRLRPRCDGALRLERFDIDIAPKPVAVSACLDIEGNSVIHAWFGDKATQLEIVTHFEVETGRTNPFDYLLDPSADTLPIAYGERLSGSLARYCLRADDDDSVAKFARSLAEAAGGHTLAFLNALNDEIQRTCPISVREKGAPHPPAHTLEHRRGSCRDVAMLFIDACRAVGIAARFVSGYQRGGNGQEKRYMHAWPEVYLPGGGWRGYDPTHGLAVADAHVAVAACREPHGATPIEGSFRGDGVSSTLDARVEIEEGR